MFGLLFVNSDSKKVQLSIINSLENRKKKMDLTGKQKRYLRAEAHHLTPIVQIGKGGLTNEIKTAIRKALDARELIKVTILQNSDAMIDDVAEEIEEMSFDVVQKIGRILIVFKIAEKRENRHISLKIKAL
jgi:RNA-binding protein